MGWGEMRVQTAKTSLTALKQSRQLFSYVPASLKTDEFWIFGVAS
jgi:hypothetical protein